MHLRYNSLLTLKRLITHCNAVMVLDNNSLGRVCRRQWVSDESADFSNINKAISTVMAASTAGLRY